LQLLKPKRQRPRDTRRKKIARAADGVGRLHKQFGETCLAAYKLVKRCFAF
jgi:hypothetical protein